MVVHFYTGTQWLALDTGRDEYFNLATAPSQGVGWYALLASVQIPLYRAGWNNIAYPVPAPQAVSVALRSISGTYSLVYGYVVTDTTDPWKVYSPNPTVPGWVNDLQVLQFGRGYWINATQAITLYLTPKTPAVDLPDPPATFYGRVLPRADFVPAAGQAVTAWANGALCGQATTQAGDGQVVYGVDVVSNCAAPGDRLTFRVAGQEMAERRPWDNQQLWALDLTAAKHMYLPLIAR